MDLKDCASPFCKAPLIGKRAKAKFCCDRCRLDVWALRRIAAMTSQIEPTEALKLLAENARLKRDEYGKTDMPFRKVVPTM